VSVVDATYFGSVFRGLATACSSSGAFGQSVARLSQVTPPGSRPPRTPYPRVSNWTVVKGAVSGGRV
jgi:hypothetical protein